MGLAARLLAASLALGALTSCVATARPGSEEGLAGSEAGAAGTSVVVGELLAIVPGALVHGLGHRYAGNREKARELLALELYSLLPAALGGGLYAIGREQDAEALEVAGWVGIGVGAVPFLGTWIYDIVFTPSEIERARRRGAVP